MLLPASSIALLASLKPFIQQVLHPQAAWGPERYHSKTLVHTIVQFLQKLVSALPLDQWSPAWADVGGTYWISRLVKDQDSKLREGALQLLKFLVHSDLTFAMIDTGWQECGSTMCKIVSSSAESSRVRAAALQVLIAAMSRPLSVPTERPGHDAGKDQNQHGKASKGALKTLNSQFILQDHSLWQSVLCICQV